MRPVMVLCGAALFLWIAIGATLAQVAPRAAVAAQLWPIAAMPRARALELAVGSGSSKEALRTIRAGAAAILSREPVNVVAARVAGLAAVATGDDRAARRFMNYASGLSRRDLGAQVMLIEFAVADDDIPRALRHYDTALRVGDDADQLLMPVLVNAARDPQVARHLRPMLDARPPWRLGFVYNLLTAAPWPTTFTSLIQAARLDVSDPQERDLLSQATKGLVGAGLVANAARLYTVATGAPVAARLRNGDFAGENRIGPFDWEITDTPGLAAVAGDIDGSPFRTGLVLNADPGRSGVVARQLLAFPPGRYRLRFAAGDGNAERDRSRVLLTCGDVEKVLAAVRVPTGAVRGRLSETSIVIPDGCQRQWLTIEAGTDIDAQDTEGAPWVSAFSIDPVSTDDRPR